MIAGKPDESHLILRIKGEEDTAHAPGGQQSHVGRGDCQDRTVGERGGEARRGTRSQEAHQVYAASPEQLVRNQIARLPPAERDKKIEAVGRERWKQANPKLKPEIVSGEHFVMFSNLPSDRATSTIKVMETQYGHLKRLIGSPATDWVEKVSLYVFSNRNDFIEFVRSVESREVDLDAHRIREDVDPATVPGGCRSRRGARKRNRRPGSGEVAVETRRGGRRRKRAARIGLWPAILTEALGAATVASAGSAPRWLARGNRFLPGGPGRASESLLPANCVKPHSPISIRAGRPGLTRPWAAAIRSPRMAFMRSGSHWWKR